MAIMDSKEQFHPEGLAAAIRNGTLQAGASVRVPNSSICWDHGKDYLTITRIGATCGDCFHLLNNRTNDGQYCCCTDQDKPFYLLNPGAVPAAPSTNSKLMSNLRDKFVALFTPEPEKSFRKAGLTDGDNLLTPDGVLIFLGYLLKQHGADFKTAVVDGILAAQTEEKG